MGNESLSTSKALHLESFSAFQVKRDPEVCYNEFKGIEASYENIVRLQVSMQYLERVQHEHTLNDLGKAISDLVFSKVLIPLGSLHYELL